MATPSRPLVSAAEAALRHHPLPVRWTQASLADDPFHLFDDRRRRLERAIDENRLLDAARWTDLEPALLGIGTEACVLHGRIEGVAHHLDAVGRDIRRHHERP